MPKNTFGQLKTGRPEEGRPIDRVESSNILTDQVQISGPIFREQFPVRIGVAKPGQVVSQRIHPHVHDMFIVARHRNAPIEGGA